jgi:putative membrane protein insertion efficiency factor
MLKRFLVLTIFFSWIANAYSQHEEIETNNQPVLTDYIDIYQKYISSVRGSSCQMYPSCSSYGMEVFKTSNPLKAFILTSDRLLRCSHDQKNYNKILTNNGVKLIDLPKPGIEEENKLFKNKINRVLYSALDTTASGRFINYLISKRYYREALLELNRLMFHDPDEMSEYQFLNFLICKRALNEMEDAVFAYDNNFPEKIKSSPLIIHEIGNINLELSNYDKALASYDRCIKLQSDSALIDRSRLMKGLTFANQKKWNESKGMFLAIPDNSIYKYSKDNCLAILQKRETLSYKSPFLAGCMSIVPGLGYVYTGHKQTALSSFIINGLLAYATYSCYRTENYGMTALVGLFSFSFYIGNISGSAKSAKRFNVKQDYNTQTKLKSNIYY